jgi:transcriptional regulator with XRE-family HTH domain
VTIAQRDAERRYLSAFGRNVRLQRVSLGLTQQQLAQRAGLCRTFIGQLERGQHGVNLVELPKIAQVLGVRQADLLPDTVNTAAGSSGW